MITVSDVEIVGNDDEVLRILLPAARAPIIFIIATTTTTSDIPRLWLPNVDFSQSSETPRRPDGISEPQAPGESSVIIVARRLVWRGQYPYCCRIPTTTSSTNPSLALGPFPGSQNAEPRVDLVQVFIRDPLKSN
jgi:hypothetical protein